MVAAAAGATMKTWTAAWQCCIAYCVWVSLAARAAAHGFLVPEFTAAMPDASKPRAGLALLPNATHSVIFNCSENTGTYSHDAQIERHNGAFHVAWANAAFNEGEDGQRVLYSSSSDGRHWSDPADIFPAVRAEYYGTPTFPPPDHFGDQVFSYIPKPFVKLNGRIYGVANIRPGGNWANIYPVPAPDLETSAFRAAVGKRIRACDSVCLPF